MTSVAFLSINKTLRSIIAQQQKFVQKEKSEFLIEFFVFSFRTTWAVLPWSLGKEKHTLCEVQVSSTSGTRYLFTVSTVQKV